MARNETPDREMEERLRSHFAEEAGELQAPEDLWDRLEGRLGKQQPPRFASLRGGVAAIGEMPWIPAAAAAVLVAGVGIGIWALAIAPGDSGDDDDAAAPVAAASDSARVREVAAEATAAAATEAAAAYEAAEAEATVAAAAQAPAEEAAATEAAAVEQAAATQAAATQAAQQEAVEEVVEVAAAVSVTEPTPEPEAVAVVEEAEPEAAATEAAAAAEEEPSEPSEPVDDMDDDMADMDADMDIADDMADMDDAAPEAGDSAGPQRGQGGDPAEPRAEEAPPQPQQPPATTFEDYERVGFVDTATDAVSTFSLDTDRTSYFLALTWVRSGYEVEPDSVRAEEWVNAFDYAYAGPDGDDEFAITSDLVMHPTEGDWHVARVGMQAPEVRDDAPLNVTLVLDASGSMSWGNRVAVARAAAEAIRQGLDDDDRIAVVHFSDHIIDRYTVQHSAPDDEDVVRSIASLTDHNSTNVQAGLNLGVKLADAARGERPDAYNYIILMSDGVANVDATDPFTILDEAPDTDSRNPLRLITIGVGIENYNDVLLEQLAQYGNGWYRYLDTTEQAQQTFARESWLALSTPFADQARAQVTWDPQVVKAWRIVGYENRATPDHTFTQDRKEFAELPSGTATTVLYELELHEGVDPSEVLGSVEVRWVEPGSGESVSQTAPLTGRTDAAFGEGDRHLRLAAIVGLAADRYSALSPQVETVPVDFAGIHADLSSLQTRLEALEGSLGSVQAYRDFSFLLERLVATAAERAPSSGYSR